MATVNAVHQNDNSMLSNVIKGVTVGGVTGYVSKYLLPVTEPEKETKEYQTAMNIIKKETSNVKGVVIEKIRNLPNKTLAQDTFIKMVDAQAAPMPDKVLNMKGVEVPPDKSMFSAASKIKLMKNLSPEDKLELRNIVASVNDFASKMYKRYVTAYEVGVTKRIRPGFVGLGAFLGFTAAVAYNVLKTDVKNA